MALWLVVLAPLIAQITLESTSLLRPGSELPPTASGVYVGTAVALLRGGEWMAVGAPTAAGGGSTRGAVWIRHRTSGSTSNVTLPLLDAAAFGTALAAVPDVFGDEPVGGATLAVGATESASTGSGSMYIIQLSAAAALVRYVRVTSGSPGFDTSLIAGDSFGKAIAVLPDLTIAVSAPDTVRPVIT